MKTTLKELQEYITKFGMNLSLSDVNMKIENELLEKEKRQIIDAHDAGENHVVKIANRALKVLVGKKCEDIFVEDKQKEEATKYFDKTFKP